MFIINIDNQILIYILYGIAISGILLSFQNLELNVRFRTYIKAKKNETQFACTMLIINILAFAIPIKFRTFMETEYSIYTTLLTEILLAGIILYANINASKILVIQTFLNYMEIIQDENFLKEWIKNQSTQFLNEKLPPLPWYKEPVTILICKTYLNILLIKEITKFQDYLTREEFKLKEEEKCDK